MSEPRPPDATGAYGATTPPPDERFAPGMVFAGRYRIVAVLGKGGMGEVWRADDLTLGQPVALKFLPPDLADEPDRLARFRAEVAAARRVSHPNVCRVHNITEADGQPFLSMEFIDGEDRAALMRRIGRLPEDKAIEVARQLCAGLGAVHDQGLLHRDLKPANIMLDGRGKVRLTDFGLAAAEAAIGPGDVYSGTPQYMAPEQMAGREVTVASDLFAVGLILYELFTGKKAFPAKDFAELKRLVATGTPPKLSSHVANLNPAVESLVLRCLEPDPARRPRSANEVLAGLPGGDPLAAALAAGETPSPDLVAAAGGVGTLPPRVAGACAAAVVVGVLVFALTNARFAIPSIAGLEKKPDQLEGEAQRMLQTLGFFDPKDPPTDTAFGFRYTADTGAGWATHPSPLEFWYRQSPHYLLPAERPPYRGENFVWGLTLTNPPPTAAGMASVRLKSDGRLAELFIAPPHEPWAAATGPSPWPTLFTFAGLEYARFHDHPVPPRWTPPAFADSSLAWETAMSDGGSLRVEAASYRDRPVYFQVVGPTARAPETVPSRTLSPFSQLAALEYRQSDVGRILGLFIFTLPPLAALILAWRNVRRGRSDRAGAFRYAAVLFGLEMVLWLFEAPHVPEFGAELQLFSSGLLRALLGGGVSWLFYLAMEPYVRRFWPDALISWNRALAGRYADPRVGRDVLIGVAVMSLWVGTVGVVRLVAHGLGTSLPASRTLVPDSLLGGRHVITVLIQSAYFRINDTLLFLMTLLLFRMVVRHAVLAALAFVATYTAMIVWGSPSLFVWFISGAFFLIFAGLVSRFGLVAACAAGIAYSFLQRLPVTSHLSAWYAGGGLVGITAVVALAAYGYFVSVDRRAVGDGGLGQ